MKNYNEYTFFYNGPFSNWYPCKFTDIKGIEYNCSEQYMMYYKALLFDDLDIASAIMLESHPREQKALGRMVKGFEIKRWNNFAKEIVWQGCFYKFTQNEDLFNELIRTDDTLLVEASPTDMVWGVGLSENDPLIKDPNNWRGTNWLGEVLTDLRENLIAAAIKY